MWLKNLPHPKSYQKISYAALIQIVMVNLKEKETSKSIKFKSLQRDSNPQPLSS